MKDCYTNENNLPLHRDKPDGNVADCASEQPDRGAPEEPRRSSAPAPHVLAAWERKIHELGKPRPIYTPASVNSTHALHYDFSAWLSDDRSFPPCTRDAIRQTAPLWLTDGLTLTEHRVWGDKVQILFTAQPDIAPVVFASRIKGRLQHALRQMGSPVKFSRKVAFRCLGDNISDAVTGYLKKQVRKEGFADPRFAKQMAEFTVVRDDVDLSEPAATVRGRYWYNLHIVLVVGGRMQFVRNEPLAKLRDGCLRISKKKGYRLKSVAVMLEHVHISLGGIPDQSPEDIALVFMNNLAWLMGRNRIWQDGYYVGTFSEYTLSDLPSQRRKAAGDAERKRPQ